MAIEDLRAATADWLDGGPDDRARTGPDRIGACAEALAVLVPRLEAMGYPVPDMVVPCRSADEVAATLAEAGGPVPPALVEVWRRIGQISLVDLDGFRHMAYWEQRLGDEAKVWACDGVVVEGACDDEGWLGYVEDHVLMLAEEGEEVAFPISPDNLHKDQTSGGGPYELVPDAADPWLASLREFGWAGPTRPSSAPEGSAPDLVSYLRTAVLECGGFPGLLGIAAFEPVRLELTDGLPVF